MIQKTLLAFGCVLLSAAALSAGDKSVMHCFAFTALDSVTDADWKVLTAATDKLPAEIPGLVHVWYGRLANPLTQIAVTATPDQIDKATIAKFRAGEVVTLPVKRLPRQFGACFQFTDKAAFDAYGKHPAHDAWVKLYEKVRVDGTTTYQILGQ